MIFKYLKYNFNINVDIDKNKLILHESIGVSSSTLDMAYEQISIGYFHILIRIDLVIQSKIPTFTPLEQGKFLSEKHRNEAGAELGAFLGRLL